MSTPSTTYPKLKLTHSKYQKYRQQKQQKQPKEPKEPEEYPFSGYAKERVGEIYLKQLQICFDCFDALEKIDDKSPEFEKIKIFMDDLKKQSIGDLLHLEKKPSQLKSRELYKSEQEKVDFLKLKLYPLYDEWMLVHYNAPIRKLYESWRAKIYSRDYCFQGGFGHSISAPGSELSYHHWVVKPERYADVVPTPEIKLTFLLLGYDWKISETPESEIWGN